MTICLKELIIDVAETVGSKVWNDGTRDFLEATHDDVSDIEELY